MPQEIDVQMTYRIVFTLPGKTGVVDVVGDLLKYYRIAPEELYATVLGMSYVDDDKDLYVFGYDPSSAKDGVVEAPVFWMGTWDAGTDEEQVYGPIHWKVIPGVIRTT